VSPRKNPPQSERAETTPAGVLALLSSLKIRVPKFAVGIFVHFRQESYSRTAS